MNYLSIDVGTTCLKYQLFSEDGKIIAYKSNEYPLKSLDGETYVDIDEIEKNLDYMIKCAVWNGGFCSVCVSSFGEAFVLLDKDDKVLFYPMLYTDKRGDDEAKELSETLGDGYVFKKTGTVPQSMYSISKLLYIKKNYPEIFAKADKALLICDYIGYLLTGQRVIDYSLASRTGVFNIENLDFDDEILEKTGINKSLFSKPERAGTVVGTLKKELIDKYGLDKKCRLVLGSHDQICSSLGAGVIKSGECVDGLGTVECITAVFDKKTDDINMGKCGYVCVPYAIEGLYCTYMLNYTCGSLQNWLRKNIMHEYNGGEKNYFAYIEPKMKDEPSGIITLPYFAGASTPYQDINAKGCILNLTTSTNDSDLFRSLLEGTAMEMRLNAEKCRSFGIKIKKAIATGGGAKSERFLQIKADIQNIPFTVLRSNEGGLCGCAILQAVANGKSYKRAVKLFSEKGQTVKPRKEEHEKYKNQYKKYKKIYKVIKEFY